jgi:hypothetical protein
MNSKANYTSININSFEEMEDIDHLADRAIASEPYANGFHFVWWGPQADQAKFKSRQQEMYMRVTSAIQAKKAEANRIKVDAVVGHTILWCKGWYRRATLDSVIGKVCDRPEGVEVGFKSKLQILSDAVTALGVSHQELSECLFEAVRFGTEKLTTYHISGDDDIKANAVVGGYQRAILCATVDKIKLPEVDQAMVVE